MEKEIRMPNHIGIIVDGNGRWAEEQGLSRSQGHLAGFKRLKELCIYAQELGLKYLSLYVFSTENFKRNKIEVKFLMDLFSEKFHSEFQEVMDLNMKIIFSGRREPLSKKILKEMDIITEKSKNNTGMVINFCINYGGQLEILDMTKKICQEVVDGKIKIDSIDLETISSHLYQDLPPLDFVIRTSGEQRISNYLLWQIAYTELFFTDTLWPDFSKDELLEIIKKFTSRERRYGKN